MLQIAFFFSKEHSPLQGWLFPLRESHDKLVLRYLLLQAGLFVSLDSAASL